MPSRKGGEEVVVMEPQVQSFNSILHNVKLAKEIVKMILLPRDWEEHKSCLLDEILSSFYPTLLEISNLYLVLFFTEEVVCRATNTFSLFATCS